LHGVRQATGIPAWRRARCGSTFAEKTMKSILVAFFTLFALTTCLEAVAADVASDAGSCEARAIDKNGKPLAGAAKASFVKKCKADKQPAPGACEQKAVDKNGRKLAGAAKASFVKKCEADAAAH
jgi:hypothetical protein